MSLAKCDHQPEEAEHIVVGAEQIPVEVIDLVVLIVGVVVAFVSGEELISGREHGSAVREHEKAEEVSYLTAPQGENLVGNSVVSFPAAVPAAVIIGAIVVAVSVGFVVLVVVGDEV